MATVRDFVPPIVVRGLKRLRKPPKPGLFDGQDEMFKREAARTRCYGEYGMGASTRWMLSNTSSRVIAVDTSKDWVAHVEEDAADEPRLTARWIDVGPIGEWGFPTTYGRRENFRSYVTAIWDRGEAPDLVLIDGRFRVACFFYSVLRAEPGTRIIFDDYKFRPQYHLVEEVLAPVEWNGRQCLFVVPETRDAPALERLVDQFLYVRD